ncbi:hypothetical protein LY78DRAFT_197900 [Colletotrichum sublineola]|nr:hypothetical protein LY78DRAFT_197900 [Colletotrichum sublineola]
MEDRRRVIRQVLFVQTIVSKHEFKGPRMTRDVQRRAVMYDRPQRIEAPARAERENKRREREKYIIAKVLQALALPFGTQSFFFPGYDGALLEG